MKVRRVEPNNRKGEFRVVTYSGAADAYPHVKAEPHQDSSFPPAPRLFRQRSFSIPRTLST